MKSLSVVSAHNSHARLTDFLEVILEFGGGILEFLLHLYLWFLLLHALCSDK